MLIKSDSIAALAGALSKAQSEIKDAIKDTKAYNYNYATLSGVLHIVRPIFSAHGLSVSQHPTGETLDSFSLTTILMHESGEFLESTCSMPVQQSKGMSHAQSCGVVITYLRRYALSAVAGITQIDNDAAMAQEESKTANELDDRTQDFLIKLSQYMQTQNEAAIIALVTSLDDIFKQLVWSKMSATQKETVKKIMEQK